MNQKILFALAALLATTTAHAVPMLKTGSGSGEVRKEPDGAFSQLATLDFTLSGGAPRRPFPGDLPGRGGDLGPTSTPVMITTQVSMDYTLCKKRPAPAPEENFMCRPWVGLYYRFDVFKRGGTTPVRSKQVYQSRSMDFTAHVTAGYETTTTTYQTFQHFHDNLVLTFPIEDLAYDDYTVVLSVGADTPLNNNPMTVPRTSASHLTVQGIR